MCCFLQDNFWSNTLEPGSSQKSTLEPDVWRHAAVSILSTVLQRQQCHLHHHSPTRAHSPKTASTPFQVLIMHFKGPVTPSDGIGYANKELIMRTCRADGLLLKVCCSEYEVILTYILAFTSCNIHGPVLRCEGWTHIRPHRQCTCGSS